MRFGDTDSAGVMHFYQLFSWCHEAWEESLELYGLAPHTIFPNVNRSDQDVSILLPIVHCEAKFMSPIQTGDHLSLQLAPKRIDIGGFQVITKFKRDNVEVALGIIRHRSIHTKTRKHCALPHDIDRWLEASSLNIGITPV